MEQLFAVSRRQDKVMKFAQEVYLIPRLRMYLVKTRKIERTKVASIISDYLNFNDNKAFDELVDAIILIANTNRAFTERL